jgi:dephospho-CoA kinase
MDEACKAGGLAILESPYPLAYMTELVDRDVHEVDIWTITAPTDVRLRRAEERGYSEMDALLRMERQPPKSAYSCEADMVIENEGTRKDLLNRVKICLKKSDWLKTN